MGFFKKVIEGIKVSLNSSQRDGVEYRTASLMEIICSMAHNGMAMCFFMISMRASYIGTEGYAIPVIIVGVILTVTKALDGVTDALAAAFFERFPATKHGKIRILVFVGWVVESLAVLVLYNWAAGKFTGLVGMVVFTSAHIMYTLGYTLAVISAGTSATVLTNDPIQRPMMAFVDMAFSYGTPVVLNFILSFFILPKYDNQWNVPMLRETSYLFVAISFVLMLLVFFGIRKVDTKEMFEVRGTEKEEKVKFRDMWNVLKDNRAAQMYIVTLASDKFAQTIASEAVVSTMLAGILIGSYQVMATVSSVTSVVGLICAFSGGIFIAKVGVKRATSLWSWISVGISVVMIAFCVFLGPWGMKQVGAAGSIPMIIFLALQIALTASKMVLSTATSAMRGDVIDYEMERSGRYMPAVVYGANSFISKLVVSLSSTIVAACVMLLGYKEVMPQMNDEITIGLFWMTIALSFGMPVLGWLCNVVAMRFYELDKKRMVEVQKHILELKQPMEAKQ